MFSEFKRATDEYQYRIQRKAAKLIENGEAPWIAVGKAIEQDKREVDRVETRQAEGHA